ncbi:SGNH/GDSL hydrolase family protein [Leptospira brenneri]|uniref:SGNH/GDSL hydrolase family protein n=1 Tax=Leptospira brenneri TaxID=2023182 RepID=UPI000C2A31ED|nr:SGNH/GDSL hydrolase family protein [Leptospira brenneri]PJZ44239.1 hypothetical protein CH361_16485 [Leptospira brenneri]
MIINFLGLSNKSRNRIFNAAHIVIIIFFATCTTTPYTIRTVESTTKEGLTGMNENQHFVTLSVVVLGDSWFDYPWYFEKNTAHQLSEGKNFKIPIEIAGRKTEANVEYHVTNLAINGQTLAQLLDQDEWFEPIVQEDPYFVILSAGGNDFLDEGSIRNIIKPTLIGSLDCRDSKKKPQCYIDDTALKGRIMELRNKIEVFAKALPIITFNAKRHSQAKNLSFQPKTIPLVLHGYDYIIERDKIECYFLQSLFRKCEWVRPILSDKKISINDQREITKYLIDNYNSMLESVAEKDENIIYVNNRGIVGSEKKDWADEIHPNSEGFRRVAENFHKVIMEKLHKKQRL